MRNLREYLLGGGHLWADDSTHFSDTAFDVAFRRELARVLPGRELARLGPEFPGFRTGYDLTRGYKGYAIPPGDKYRLNYLEGVTIDGKVAVVYTRNDYGDGLDIDPNTHPIMPSLTDLSPAEMQEGALRMGINLVLYFLTAGDMSAAEFLHQTSTTLREAEDATVDRLADGPERQVDTFAERALWSVEAWGDEATLATAGSGLDVAFEVGDRGKAAVSRSFEGLLALGSRDTLALEAESLLQCGCRIALGLVVGGVYYETAPFYLKPGMNTAFFRLASETFKTEATDWEFRAALPAPAPVERLTLLIYSPSPGRVRLRNLRVVREEEE